MLPLFPEKSGSFYVVFVLFLWFAAVRSAAPVVWVLVEFNDPESDGKCKRIILAFERNRIFVNSVVDK